MITLRPVCPPLGRLSTTVQQDQRCTAKRSKVLKYSKIQRNRVHKRNVRNQLIVDVEMTAGANKTKRHKKSDRKKARK